jgi:hypothetical protein
MGARREVVSAVAERYRSARRTEKGRILDELCATTGWHRKHAVRALRRHETPNRIYARRARRRRYGAIIKDALTALWEASDRVCGVFRIERRLVVDGTGVRIPNAAIPDFQAGAGTWRQRPQGRARHACVLRQGAVLACLLRVQTWTRVSRCLGAHPADHSPPQARERWSAPRNTIHLGHRGRHQGLLGCRFIMPPGFLNGVAKAE